MRRLYGSVLFLTVVLVATAGPAAGENPRISLKLDQVTFADAAAALSRATGLSITWYQPAGAGGAPPQPAPPMPAGKASFDWRGLSLADALRQLCRRYHLWAGQRPGGYELGPAMGAASENATPKPVGLFEKGDVRIFAQGISVQESSHRQVSFLDGSRPQSGYSSMCLAIGCIWRNGDAQSIAGVQNIAAKDDLGNVQGGSPGGAYGGDSSGFGALPDEWTGQIQLDGPDARAKKLAWVEGDLVVYARMIEHHEEATLPPAEGAVTQNVGPARFVLSRYHVIPREAAGDDEVDAPGNVLTVNEEVGPSFRVQLVLPESARLRGCAGTLFPELVGASGRRYRPHVRGGGGSGSNGVLITDHTVYYPDVVEPAVKLVWDIIEPAEPRKLLRFRMADIPLPPPPAPQLRPAARFGRHGTAPPPLPDDFGPIRPGHPLYDSGGGTISSRVTVRERPAPGGTLQIGLARKEGADWGSVRWADLEMVGAGEALLEHLKPGTYRVLRVYHPKQPSPLPGAGHWIGSETVVGVVAGKEVAAPALQWVPDADGPANPPRSSGPPARGVRGTERRR